MEQIAAIFAIFAIWVFSPGPNEVFDRVKAWAFNNFAANNKKFFRFIFQIIYCPWCSAVIFAVALCPLFRVDFWLALAVLEATATITMFRSEK